MAKNVEGTIERVYCNTCRNTTRHELLKQSTHSFSDEEAGFSWRNTFDMFECCGCSDVVLRRTHVFSEDPEITITFFPPKSSRFAPNWVFYLPPKQRQLLEEVYKSLDSQGQALPMMGVRALLDLVAADKVGDIGGFSDKIKRLVEKGLISPNNAEVLSAVLDIGHAAAHRGHFAEDHDLHAVMDIIENLLQSVYVFDRLAKSLKSRTPQRNAKTATL
jgi:hypothetical protein